MYDVIFKIIVEPIAYLKAMNRSGKHTFIIAKGNKSINNENDIEEYDNLVNEFKQFSDIEYDKISKYCFNAKVTAYMCFYNKKAYEKYKKKEGYIQEYLEKDNKMPYYDTILQQYCEFKTYNPKNKIIKSGFISFEEIKYYDKREKSLLADSIYQTIRRELINDYILEYKAGDIVEYEGKIAIVAFWDTVENKVLYTCKSLDETFHCTNYDLKPYTGEISEDIESLLEFYDMMYSIKYKEGEIVEYKGKIAIVMPGSSRIGRRQGPGPDPDHKVWYYCKSLDKSFHCTNFDLKPYTGKKSKDIRSLRRSYIRWLDVQASLEIRKTY